MTVYVDVLFLINFSMDFVSLFLCVSIFRKKLHKGGILLSSAIGGIYAVFDILLDLNQILKIIICVLVSVIMCLIAFKERTLKGFFTMLAMYWAVNMALGGIMSLLYSYANRILSEIISEFSYENTYNGARFFIIAALSTIISVVFGRIFTAKKDIKSVRFVVTVDKTEYELSGLCDSGNMLTEPLSGRAVILVTENSSLGKKIISLPEIYKRYIPYNDVSGSGIIRGIIPENIKINQNTPSAVVATISKRDFAGYDAIVPISIV